MESRLMCSMISAPSLSVLLVMVYRGLWKAVSKIMNRKLSLRLMSMITYPTRTSTYLDTKAVRISLPLISIEIVKARPSSIMKLHRPSSWATRQVRCLIKTQTLCTDQPNSKSNSKSHQIRLSMYS